MPSPILLEVHCSSATAWAVPMTALKVNARPVADSCSISGTGRESVPWRWTRIDERDGQHAVTTALAAGRRAGALRAWTLE